MKAQARRRRHRRGVVLPLALLAVIAVPVVALAAHPIPGATYRGTDTVGDFIKIKVNRAGNHYSIKTRDPCGGTTSGSGLTITSRGRFDAINSRINAEIVGRFVSRRVAKGTFLDGSCRMVRSPFTLRKR